MTRSRYRLLLAALLAMLTLGVAACGGDDDKGDNGGSGGSTPSAAPAKATAGGTDDNVKLARSGKPGGKLTMLASSDVDFLDPGKTYYTFGQEVIGAFSSTLYAFTPEHPTDMQPELAAAMPEISDDKKTVTVKIKDNVKYGPPVNRAVTSKDIKYAFERFFSVNVGGQYPGYFQGIVGAPKKPTTGVKPISGIETPDDQTIVFKLSEPTGPAFAPALVMTIAVPVPEDYAKKYDAKNPSTYNTHVVSSGPYMVENDSSGNLTGYKPGKSISLVRNPNWGKTDDRPAYLDSIFIKTNASDANVSARQVIDGQNLVLDTNPPSNILRDLVTKIKDQYTTVSSGGFRYFPMNISHPPFNDINVRKAVMAGFDRDAARKARGGKYVGPIATHFLPPDFPGYEEGGGAAGAGVDYFSDKNEKGDMAIAAKYFKAAGMASGKYEGNAEVLMVGANADPGKAQAEVAKAQLEKMGFKVRLRLVPQDSVYSEWCQVPPKKVNMCAGAGWFKDFYDPQVMLEPTFKGALINKTSGNINYSELNDPKIDAAMDKAALLEGDARLKAWGEIDKMIIGQAPAIPFVWDNTTLVRSKNVQGVVNNYIALWDFTYTSIK